ncbi:MAG: hypothetical protein AB7E31_00700 [Desulfitobacterium sp.]
MIYSRERLLSEQLPVLREKFSTEKGWKQDVSNPLRVTSAKAVLSRSRFSGRNPDEDFAQAARHEE